MARFSARSSLEGKKRIKFQAQAERGGEVYVAGSFNEWNPKKDRLEYDEIAGNYSTSLLLSKGKHEYKFVINGAWSLDPECPDWVPNGLGSLNSVITVN
jgi:1,4-alpha-glucan branching enzyme